MRVRYAKFTDAYTAHNDRPGGVCKRKLADAKQAEGAAVVTQEKRSFEFLTTKTKRNSRSTPVILPQIDVKSAFKVRKLQRNADNTVVVQRPRDFNSDELLLEKSASVSHYQVWNKQHYYKSDSAVYGADRGKLVSQISIAYAEIAELRRVIDAQDGRILELTQREADRTIDAYYLEIEALTDRIDSAERREGALKRYIEENDGLTQRLTEKVASLFAENDELMRRIDELLRYAAGQRGREDFLRVYLYKLVLYSLTIDA